MTPLVTVTNLTKHYGSMAAVQGLEFNIGKGRCVALLGPNGAGKTTTLNMLTGILSPSSGEILFKNMDRGDDLRSFIGYLPQYPSFYNWLTGREFLLLAGQLAHLSKREAAQRADDMMQLVGIAEAGNRRIGGYSGGMKQRLGLAQAMIHQPQLLILDEPVSALDPVGRRDVLNLMRQLKQETTVLFSTHVLHDAEEISDDVIIIHQGEIVIAGDPTTIRAEHRQPVINIQLEHEHEAEELANMWQGDELIAELIKDQLHIQLIVRDMEQARKKIIQQLAARHIAIQKFETAETTLEDLFMKAVSQ